MFIDLLPALRPARVAWNKAAQSLLVAADLPGLAT
jgi:hypothetical protein